MPAPGRSFIGDAIRALVCAGPLLLSAPAAAQLALCNRTSFVLDTAVALEGNGTAATRGWFRLDPGQCRPVLSGDVAADRLLLHARALPVYGRDAFTQDGRRELCVAAADFLIAGATTCTGDGQVMARFTEVQPRPAEVGHLVTMTEDADYTLDAARLAGVQRLLALAGYDPGPVDGVAGPRTDAALALLLRDHRLPPDTPQTPGAFAALVAAAGADAGRGLTWCNDTAHAVMAALGVDERGHVVTRGWWRIDPGSCLKPDVERGRTPRLYSFAEAVDAAGAAVLQAGRPLAWGGTVLLCTRNTRFELRDQSACAARGLEARGFVAIDLAGHRGATLRFGTGRAN